MKFGFNPNACEITKLLHKYAGYDDNILEWALHEAYKEDIMQKRNSVVSIVTIKKYIDMQLENAKK